MRLAELSAGWRTDFIVHRHDGLVVERDDCIVVRTPDNPTFFWGNFLLLPTLPGDDALERWLARFDDEIGCLQPASRHRAFGVNAPCAQAELPHWQRAGFELQHSHVMQLGAGALQAPARAARGEVSFRSADLPRESADFVELQCADTMGHPVPAYRAFRERKMAAVVRMQATGAAQWFGVWCDGVLAADCGLVRDGELGRFQHVSTHPAWRRRGLCSTLVHAVSQWGFMQWGLRTIVMVADPDDVAIGIYRSLGYTTALQTVGLERGGY
jgi:ribosomal protein S18 acetylase RimI-like enzyme